MLFRRFASRMIDLPSVRATRGGRSTEKTEKSEKSGNLQLEGLHFKQLQYWRREYLLNSNVLGLE